MSLPANRDDRLTGAIEAEAWDKRRGPITKGQRNSRMVRLRQGPSVAYGAAVRKIRREIEAEEQHGPVRIIVQNGKPV